MDELLKPRYLDTPAQWDRLAEVLRAAGVIGFDTEYYGVAKNESCVGRARVHVWSVAVRTGRLDARGYTSCRGWMLPGAALAHRGLRAVLEDPLIRKEIHNQGVDIHAVRNHGVRLRGARNTLGLVRWKRPELISTPGRFKLKALMRSLLHRDPVCTFKELVADTRIVVVKRERKKKVKGCSCGVADCRRRKTVGGVEHKKWKRKETVYLEEEKVEAFDWPLEQIVPGHHRFNRLKAYSIEDSIAALQVGEICDETPDPAPFPFGERPDFSQGVEDGFTDMEAVGFHRDRLFCANGVMTADAMEDAELSWLYNWFVVNSGEYGPHHRVLGRKNASGKMRGVDGVWSSHKQLLAHLDELGAPRSPIWKKGRVKKGDAKLDETALEWVGKADPAFKKLVKHLIQLKRVRGGRKYLTKLRDAADVVHVIAGPSSDDDERAGAVTGRAGIKGPLEAQQLPSPDNADKDLFLVRKAIVATGGETLLVADYSSLEIGIQGEWCLRLFGDRQILQMYEDQNRCGGKGCKRCGGEGCNVDMHSNNARNVFGTWLKWTVPKTTKVEGKEVECKYAGSTVDRIPVQEFKKHPFGKKLRAMIKAIWYGLAYGKGAYGFSTLEGADGEMIGEELADKMVNALLDAVPGMRRWFEWVQAFVRTHHGIYSLGGRWCDLADEMESDDEWLWQRAFRRAYNFPMQATGADIIGDAMVRINKCPFLRALGFRICLQVHDELVLRGPLENVEEAMELVREHMVAATANGIRLLVPLQVSVGHGQNYYDAK